VADWGSTAAERAEALPCDALLEDADERLHRAVDVEAPAATVFRWLCQLRAAPYSYDRLDNGGRQSPQTLTPGLERLERGQRVMRIFELVGFEQDRSITVLHEGRLFGRVAVTYRVSPLGERRARLLARLLVAYDRGPLTGLLARSVLPPGDLVMMRRQLLNLKRLAEGTAAVAGQSAGFAGGQAEPAGVRPPADLPANSALEDQVEG
jgi:hypothetical protein